MSDFRYELAAARKIIDDEEMIGYITIGLDNTYNALVERVDNTPSISLTDVTNQINSFDMRQCNALPFAKGRTPVYLCHSLNQ
jgi:hypothetical protein